VDVEIRAWGRPLALKAGGAELRAAMAVPPQPRGHVVLLPGRAEFVEKYAGVVAALVGRGLAVAALDWRGQGGSARLAGDPMTGHVGDFADYRADLDALTSHPDVTALPGPRVLVAHSMGATVALDWGRSGGRADLAVLSAPMLGIRLSPVLAPLAPGLARLAVRAGLARRPVPGTGRSPYALGPFEGNVLTSDPAAFAAMAAFLRAHPDVGIGGLTFGWLDAAFRAMAALRGSAVAVPSLVVLGTTEALVEPAPIRDLGLGPRARLVEIEGARHEPFMETPERRALLWREIAGFLDAHGL
jgi:lysophospholipase